MFGHTDGGGRRSEKTSLHNGQPSISYEIHCLRDATRRRPPPMRLRFWHVMLACLPDCLPSALLRLACSLSWQERCLERFFSFCLPIFVISQIPPPFTASTNPISALSTIIVPNQSLIDHRQFRLNCPDVDTAKVSDLRRKGKCYAMIFGSCTGSEVNELLCRLL